MMLLRLLACIGPLLLASPAAAADRTTMRAPAAETARLVVHGAADFPAMEPLFRDFQTIEPGTTIDYVEYVTSELLEVATAACAGNRRFADLLVTSAVDHLVKLANDGCAAAHQSAQTTRVPRWANWRDEVFGFTVEPAVIVYNRDAVPADQAPRTHAQLAELLRTQAERYRGRVGTYDIRLSGIGYLFAFSDLQQTSTTYGRLLESMGRISTVLRCCSGEVLDEVASGRLFIGYNMLGSYAYARLKRGAPIRIVLPRDYTLVLSRGVMIPRQAADTGPGRRFLDYLLSERGQRVAREEAFFFGADMAPPAGVDAPASLSSSGILRPIVVGPGLLLTQDRARRERFISDWSLSMVEMGPGP